MNYFLGIDGGGSKVLCQLQSDAQKVLWEKTYPGCKASYDLDLCVQHTLNAIKQAAPFTKGAHLYIGVGWAGLGSTHIRKQYQQHVQAQANQPLTMATAPDTTIACHAVHQGQNRGIVIAGTGSIGWAVIDGKEHRWGGWNVEDGGFGGGYWLGKQAMIQTLMALDGRLVSSPLTQEIAQQFNQDPFKLSQTFTQKQKDSQYVASFAKIVTKYAQQKDPYALKLMQKAGAKLSDLCMFGLQKNIPIALIGGLAPSVYPFLDERTQPHISLSNAKPITGALTLARGLLK